MRRVVLLAALVLTLSLMASATSYDISNHNGTITGGSSGLTLTGSVITFYQILGSTMPPIQGPNLGSITFTTGAFTKGDPQMGGTLAGGPTTSFTITIPKQTGIPNGFVFTGTFTSATWTLVTLDNGTHNYVLSGAVKGSNGFGAITQITVNTGTGFFNGSVGLSSGDTNLTLTAVPEPGTLGLLGTGLIGIAGLMRRKLRIG